MSLIPHASLQASVGPEAAEEVDKPAFEQSAVPALPTPGPSAESMPLTDQAVASRKSASPAEQLSSDTPLPSVGHGQAADMAEAAPHKVTFQRSSFYVPASSAAWPDHEKPKESELASRAAASGLDPALDPSKQTTDDLNDAAAQGKAVVAEPKQAGSQPESARQEAAKHAAGSALHNPADQPSDSSSRATNIISRGNAEKSQASQPASVTAAASLDTSSEPGKSAASDASHTAAQSEVMAPPAPKQAASQLKAHRQGAASLDTSSEPGKSAASDVSHAAAEGEVLPAPKQATSQLEDERQGAAKYAAGSALHKPAAEVSSAAVRDIMVSWDNDIEDSDPSSVIADEPGASSALDSAIASGPSLRISPDVDSTPVSGPDMAKAQQHAATAVAGAALHQTATLAAAAGNGASDALPAGAEEAKQAAAPGKEMTDASQLAETDSVGQPAAQQQAGSTLQAARQAAAKSAAGAALHTAAGSLESTSAAISASSLTAEGAGAKLPASLREDKDLLDALSEGGTEADIWAARQHAAAAVSGAAMFLKVAGQGSAARPAGPIAEADHDVEEEEEDYDVCEGFEGADVLNEYDSDDSDAEESDDTLDEYDSDESDEEDSDDVCYNSVDSVYYDWHDIVEEESDDECNEEIEFSPGSRGRNLSSPLADSAKDTAMSQALTRAGFLPRSRVQLDAAASVGPAAPSANMHSSQESTQTPAGLSNAAAAAALSPAGKQATPLDGQVRAHAAAGHDMPEAEELFGSAATAAAADGKQATSPSGYDQPDADGYEDSAATAAAAAAGYEQAALKAKIAAAEAAARQAGLDAEESGIAAAIAARTAGMAAVRDAKAALNGFSQQGSRIDWTARPGKGFSI